MSELEKKPTPNDVLRAAMGRLDDVLIIGFKKGEARDFYYAGSTGNKATLLYLLESFKHILLAGAFDG